MWRAPARFRRIRDLDPSIVPGAVHGGPQAAPITFPAVRDGLVFIGSRETTHCQPVPPCGAAEIKAQWANLPAIRRAPLLSPNGRGPVRTVKPVAPGGVRCVPLDRAGVKCTVVAARLLRERGRLGNSRASLFQAALRVADGTPRMRAFPHIRTGEDPASLSGAEVEEFLREAQYHAGDISQERALVAVFRNVPAEMISRIRFLEGRGAVLYTLVPKRPGGSIRLHDLGVVFNRALNKTEMFAHRTRCRIIPIA